MQDKLTEKKTNEQSETKNDGVARALSSLYKSALKEEDLQVQREDASYYRKLARPRSEKYLELMSREMQIAERLGELYRQLEENGGSVTATAGNGPKVPGSSDTTGAGQETKATQASDVVTSSENTENPQAATEWWQEDVKPLRAENAESGKMSGQDIPDGKAPTEILQAERNGQTEQETQIEQEAAQPQTKEWWQEDVQRKQQKEEIVDNSAILAEIAQLKAELVDVRTALEAEMPVGHGRLGMIYPLDKEGRLINLGAIAAPGTPFNSVDELLNQVKPQTEQEKRQWEKGNAAYWDVRGECLVVEIYLTAICVVFEDGSVKSYRD